jgi:hypothetical protein
MVGVFSIQPGGASRGPSYGVPHRVGATAAGGVDRGLGPGSPACQPHDGPQLDPWLRHEGGRTRRTAMNQSLLSPSPI